MKMRVLGCHGGETVAHRTSSFLIDDKLAIDAGAVTSATTLEEQRGIASVLVSHSHLDHVRDLATLVDTRCQQGGPSVEVVGPSDTIATLREHFFNNRLWPDFTRIMASDGPALRFRELAYGQPADVAGYEVTAVPVDHTVDSSAFVVASKEAVIAYSGDTGPTEELWKVLDRCKRLDALLLEVAFPNRKQGLADVSKHHTPQTAQTDLAKLRNHKQVPVLLYHIKPVFEAEIEREICDMRTAQDLHVLRLNERFSW